MPTWMVVLFYIWLVVSVIALIYRRAVKPRTPRPEAPSARRPMPPSETIGTPDPGAGSPAIDGRAATPVPRAAASLMDALEGIAMPCDLVPLNIVEGRSPNERQLALFTTGHDAGEVGRALADELERLGYEVVSMAPNEAHATRGADRLRVTIHARPGDILVGKQPAYPTAPADSVVVELEL